MEEDILANIKMIRNRARAYGEVIKMEKMNQLNMKRTNKLKS
jgi:hypothetical protein